MKFEKSLELLKNESHLIDGWSGTLLGGGGKRHGVRDVVRGVDFAAKQLGSEAAKSVMGNTESILAPMAGEESSSLRTVVSIRNAGAGENQNEIIQSNPSPEFLNSLPFIKKFYPAPLWGEGKLIKVTHENSSNTRHSEAFQSRKNPAYYCNTSKLKGIHMNNSTKTNHASTPLGILASKSVSCRHSVLKLLLARNCHSYCCRRYEFRSSLPELATRPQFRNTDLHKKVAFTLAEVLITLGIIGVVAAVTLPTLVANYQKTVWVNQLKKAYSVLNNGVKQMIVEQGCSDITCTNFSDNEGNVEVGLSLEDDFIKQFVKTFKLSNVQELTENNNIYSYSIKYLSGNETMNYSDLIVGVGGTTPDGMIVILGGIYYAGDFIFIDTNGLKSPNQWGRDIFAFKVSLKGAVVPYYSKAALEVLNLEKTEKERIETVEAGCNTSSEKTGVTCAEKIIMDGWKMNY